MTCVSFMLICRKLNCYRCAVMNLKHENVIQYKESEY